MKQKMEFSMFSEAGCIEGTTKKESEK